MPSIPTRIPKASCHIKPSLVLSVLSFVCALWTATAYSHERLPAVSCLIADGILLACAAGYSEGCDCRGKIQLKDAAPTGSPSIGAPARRRFRCLPERPRACSEVNDATLRVDCRRCTR